MQYFASILAYTGIQRKKKGNDQDLIKYLINDCSSSGLCVYACVVYGLQIVLSLAQSVPWAQKKWAQGSLCICRDGSVSTFSEFLD